MLRLLKPPGGDAAFSAAVFLLGAVYLFWRYSQSQIALLLAGAVPCLAVGIGLWFRQRWACWLAIATLTGMGAFDIAVGFSRGFTLRRIAAIAILPFLIRWLWQLKFGPTSEPSDNDSTDSPVPSLVGLLREPRELDSKTLAECATRAWNATIHWGEATDDMTSFATGQSPHFIVGHDNQIFTVLNVADSYVQDVDEACRDLPDLRLQHALREHAAWISVDYMTPAQLQSDPAPQAGYRMLGRLLAELLGADCLAVYCPAASRLHPFSDSTLAKLRSDDPLRELGKSEIPSVIPIAADDPRMQQAVAEAREHWPEFVAAFEVREPNQFFSVKAPITEDEITEFMWLKVTAIEGDRIFGTLENEPVQLSRKFGQKLSIPVDELNDWIFVKGEAIQGGYTVKVLSDQSRRIADSDDEDEPHDSRS